MFKFFPDDDNPGNKEGEGEEENTSEISFSPCKEILISDFHSNLLNVLKNKNGGIGGGGGDGDSGEGQANVTDVKVWKTKSLKCVNLARLGGLEEVFKEEDEKVHKILRSTTDLVPGEYEGGFKTWECTFDLITYVHDHCEEILKKRQETSKKPLRVLDMGCGSGLVGLAVLIMAESMGVEVTVDFQDYNEEVINYVTIPNTLLNFQDEMASRCRFFSGDWDSFKDVIGSKSTESKSQVDEQDYDLILSSETIYNLNYFPKFLRTIKSCLKRDGGYLYLAAKTFYFGVGGGTRVFLDMVNEDDLLEGSVVHVIKHGVQREIIRCWCRAANQQ